MKALKDMTEADFNEALGLCPCGGKQKPGVAIAQTWTGMPEWPGATAVTMSPGGPGRLVECVKCEKCGKSWTRGQK